MNGPSSLGQDREAAGKIERIAHELANVICDSASSIEAVDRLLQIAMHVTVVRARINAMSPAFQNRIERERAARAEMELFDQRAALSVQLKDLGIDPGPIFQNTLNGGG